MFTKTSTAPGKKKLGANKLVLGFAAVAATAIIGATGVAAAQTNNVGSGYGGNTSNVNIEVNGGNNVIQIIFNFFF